ncbi:MAG: hypothetical protein AAF934_01675 [Bacteroidota bacterium]
MKKKFHLLVKIQIVLLGILTVFLITRQWSIRGMASKFNNSLPMLKLSHAFSDYLTKIDSIEYNLYIGKIEKAIALPKPPSITLICNSANYDNSCPELIDEIYDVIENDFYNTARTYFELLTTIGNEKTGSYARLRENIWGGFVEAALNYGNVLNSIAIFGQKMTQNTN